MTLDLSLRSLRSQYLDGTLTPLRLVDMLDEAMRAADADIDHHVWIQRLSLDELRHAARALDGRDPASLPLYGIPFAIKDNIDLEGVPTTAACPAFAYTPSRSATAVQRLIDAGAIPIGKTNLDQFATGLVGSRSPYGAGRNAIDPDYISGGSSSGSAVAVALGLASFSLGTDTAGSGRVPAMLNNLIGLKPTIGRIPTTGLVPACRTLDVISIFALSAADAAAVLAVAQGEDEADAYSRAMPAPGFDFGASAAFRFGVPRADDLEFHGNADGPAQFERAIAALQALGGTPVAIDLRPFLDVARLLYDGPWVAERYAAIRPFIEAHPEALHPITRAITQQGASVDGPSTFEGLYRLKALQKRTAPVWRDIDLLLVPTASRHYTLAEVEAEPVRLNSNLGHYTNFVNLLDLCAVAVPTGFMPQPNPRPSLPWGVTFIAPAGRDLPLLSLAARLHASAVDHVGATPHAPHRVTGGVESVGASTMASTKDSAATPTPGRQPTFEPTPIDHAPFPTGQVRVAVCGAHLSGLPLNHQLTDRGARLVRKARSAPLYKLYALPGGPPHRPGMVRVDVSKPGGGAGSIELEVWELPAAEFGSFIAAIPAPLGIGWVALEDATAVQGFICEAHAVRDATDITRFGGWRAYLAEGLATCSPV